MTQAEPSLPVPLPPSTIDFASVFAAHRKQADREAELRPANKERLFDALGEQHVREDVGFIPSFTDWVKAIRPEPWMGRTEKIEALVDPHLAPPVLEVR